MSILSLSSVVLSLFAFVSQAHGEVHLTVLQTSDLHSHFTNRESPLGLGGVARLATKIRDLRSQNRNSLLLDGGDWSEGSIFFTLDSGEASQRVLQQLGYDAIVLGNHDWLIGAADLYQTLDQSNMKIPILSSNMDFRRLPKEIDLQKFIKPYIIREFDGVKVGIIGTSTFELIYDAYFRPVRINDPYRVMEQYVQQLRDEENCQAIIVLSHLGIAQDKLLARIPGIDLIVGGHTHLLMTKPAYVGDTAITHVGRHGEYLGQIDLLINDDGVSVEQYKVHPMDSSVPEEPLMAGLVNGFVRDVEKKFGNVFNDGIVVSNVDLPIQQLHVETAFNNIVVDAMREVAGSDVAFDNPMFSSRNLYAGTISSADIFNTLSHIYDRHSDKTWTVHSFEIPGYYLRALIGGFFRLNFSISMSNVQLVLDRNKKLDQVKSLKVGGEDISSNRSYTIAGNNGIVQAVNFLNEFGIPIHAKNLKDTGVEQWRLAAAKLAALSPITSDKVPWQGRVRSAEPDFMLRAEDVVVDRHNGVVDLKVLVRNNGLTPTGEGKLSVAFNPSQTGLEDTLMPFDSTAPEKPVGSLEAGAAQTFVFRWDARGLQPGRYYINVKVTGSAQDYEGNNMVETYIANP